MNILRMTTSSHLDAGKGRHTSCKWMARPFWAVWSQNVMIAPSFGDIASPEPDTARKKIIIIIIIYIYIYILLAFGMLSRTLLARFAASFGSEPGLQICTANTTHLSYGVTSRTRQALVAQNVAGLVAGCSHGKCALHACGCVSTSRP